MTFTFIVREEPTGEWVMGCCDDLHGYAPIYANYATKRAAERAATAHRADDRTQREATEMREAAMCATCHQPLPVR